jgi:hypothetical protein
VSRRKRGGAGNFIGALLIGLVMAALGGFGAAAFLLRPPPTDAETLCRTDAPLGALTRVLVESTARLEPRHRRKLRAVLAQERARLGQYDRLTLMRLNARRPQEPTILFSRCLPRLPEQTNPLFENARRTQERWDADFAGARTARCAAPPAVGARINRRSWLAYAPPPPIRTSTHLSPGGGWCWCQTCWSTIRKASHITSRPLISPPGARKRL